MLKPSPLITVMRCYKLELLRLSTYVVRNVLALAVHCSSLVFQTG